MQKLKLINSTSCIILNFNIKTSTLDALIKIKINLIKIKINLIKIKINQIKINLIKIKNLQKMGLNSLVPERLLCIGFLSYRCQCGRNGISQVRIVHRCTIDRRTSQESRRSIGRSVTRLAEKIVSSFVRNHVGHSVDRSCRCRRNFALQHVFRDRRDKDNTVLCAFLQSLRISACFIRII